MRVLFLAMALVAGGSAWGVPASDGWITHPQADASKLPIILHFRRVFDHAKVPASLPVTVTADNRYILFVNGRRVASGPSAGTLAHWRRQTIDLAPYLHDGRNVVAATVWDFVRAQPQVTGELPAASALPPQVAPIAQQSAGLGFRLSGEGLSTAAPGWRVKIDEGHSAANGRAQVPRGLYYVASAPEVIDAAKADWDWAGLTEPGGGWQDAVPAAPAARSMIPCRSRVTPLPRPGLWYAATLPGPRPFPVRR